MTSRRARLSSWMRTHSSTTSSLIPCSAPCRQLFLRIENNELQGLTSSHVLADVVHRVMTLEAASLFSRPMTGMANWLKQHPAEVQRLSRHRLAVDDISLMGIQVVPVTGPLVSLA